MVPLVQQATAGVRAGALGLLADDLAVVADAELTGRGIGEELPVPVAVTPSHALLYDTNTQQFISYSSYPRWRWFL